ncbi:MAG: hypothetical protein MZV65_48280 [Chromatiales bacterium]|nr:hypothetical protein [Chromatiales bacterium]
MAGPAYKVLGDVAARRGKMADAIALYNQSLGAASEDLPAPGADLPGQRLHCRAASRSRRVHLYDQIPIAGQPGAAGDALARPGQPPLARRQAGGGGRSSSPRRRRMPAVPIPPTSACGRRKVWRAATSR